MDNIETLVIYYIDELIKISECSPNQNQFTNMLWSMSKDDLNRTFSVLNRYGMWRKFQYLARCLIPILYAKIVLLQQYNTGLCNECAEALIMLLKYPIIDSEVLISVNFISYLLSIIKTYVNNKQMDEYIKKLIILTMQRLPLYQQNKLYSAMYIRYFNSSPLVDLFYLQPQKSHYPNGLYGSALEDRIFIHTIPCDDDNIAYFEGCYLMTNEVIKGRIKKSTRYGYEGKFDHNSKSLLEVKENGDKLIFHENKRDTGNEKERSTIEIPIIYNHYNDHRVGIKNANAPGVQNACYMISALQALYHSNEILELSYIVNTSNDFIKNIFIVLHELDIGYSSVLPNNIIESLKNINGGDRFTKNNQQDSSEFIQFLVSDVLPSTCKEISSLLCSNVCQSVYCMECGNMRSNDANEQYIFDSSLPKNFFPIYDVIVLSFEEIKNRLTIMNNNDNNNKEYLDVCSSFYEKDIKEALCVLRSKEKKEKYLTYIGDKRKHKSDIEIRFNGKTIYCSYKNDEEPITDLIVLENNNVTPNGYEYSCELHDYMYLYYKKNYPIIPNCLTENEISKEYYRKQNIYNQNKNIKYSKIPSDIKILHKQKDVLPGYEIVNYNQILPLQCGVEYYFSFDRKNRIRFDKPCRIYEICFNYYDNNIKTMENYTGVFGISGDEDNYGFSFSNVNGKCNGLLFEFQNNRNLLHIHKLNYDSVASISFKSIFPLSLNNETSSIYESYSVPNIRIDITKCKYSSIGYIGYYMNKMIAIIDNNDNKNLTVDYYEKGNIYSYNYLKENTNEKHKLDVYSPSNELIGSLKMKDIEMYQVKYIDNKYLFMNRYYEYVSKSYSLEDIITSCLYDIENSERECKRCKNNTLSYVYSNMFVSDNMPQYLLVNIESVIPGDMNKLTRFINLTTNVNLSNNHNQTYKYDLYGVILHCGTYEAGHYTCYFRRSNSRNMEQYDDENNPWYYCNDDRTEKSSWGRIIKELLFTPLTTIKMVFLSKHNDFNECDHNGLNYIQPMNKSLRLEEYEKYYPEDLVGYDEYFADHPYPSQIPLLSVNYPPVPSTNVVRCLKCSKYFYPF